MDRRDGILGLGGWITFGILFLWQLPHFMAISWIYREDDAGAASRCWPRATTTAWPRPGKPSSTASRFSSSAPPAVFFVLRTTSISAGAIVAGSLRSPLSALLSWVRRTPIRARRLFMASNIYLIVMMALLVFA